MISKKILAVGTCVLIALTVAVGWWLYQRNLGVQSKVPNFNGRLHQYSLESPTANNFADSLFVQTEVEEINHVKDPVPLTSERSILNVECRLRSGVGLAKEVAVVTLFNERGASFSVLDDTGALTSGELEYQPNHIRIGRRADSSVVYGFGDLRLNSKVFRPRDTSEPVQIYHDDLLIYETNKAWDFDVSSDGSSFFVHEPAPGGASRLVVRNIDLGTQEEFDLGTRMTPVSDHARGHTLNYSLDSSEIVFYSSQADATGRGVYYFYSVEDGRRRRITIEGDWAAMLTSSELGYFVSVPEELDPIDFGNVWQVTKRRLDPSRGETEDLWSKRIEIREHHGLLSISQNGKWLGMSGYDYKVLDTENGEAIFSFPSAGNPSAKLARLAPILDEGATEKDMGLEGFMGFEGNVLVGYRTYGNTDSCRTKPGERYNDVKRRECIKTLRLQGLYREYYDIYDMNSIELDSSPAFTTQVYSESSCMPMDGLWRGLLDIDGKLAYRSYQPSEISIIP